MPLSADSEGQRHRAFLSRHPVKALGLALALTLLGSLVSIPQSGHQANKAPTVLARSAPATSPIPQRRWRNPSTAASSDDATALDNTWAHRVSSLLRAKAIAQDFDALLEASGERATSDEQAIWGTLEGGKPIEAREKAAKHLQTHPDSFVAHLVIALVLHYQEASFPRAAYHIEQARSIFEKAYGAKPRESATWKWHARILRELVSVLGDLERHAAKLRAIQEFNALYEPKMIADRAWPLMKMRRFDAARKAAREALATGQPMQVSMAKNALCAIEFEAGRNEESYEACREALEHARVHQGKPSTVDLTNFAEASRSVFRLDEAERILLEATKADISWYGNPWLELGELYLRQSRYPEALHALKQTQVYRNSRPPHVRDADRNEVWRAVASFFLLTGEYERAREITERALLMPDRRGHNSRPKYQDRAVIALLDRAVRRAEAERVLENAVGEPWWSRAWSWLNALQHRIQGWQSGRIAVRLLSESQRLVGFLQLGAATSGITPPWLIADLSELIGHGTMLKAIEEARDLDRRDGASDYYDAISVELSARDGDPRKALQQYRSMTPGFAAREPVMFARPTAYAAKAALQQNRVEQARAWTERTLELDPGVFRRLRLRLPVALRADATTLRDWAEKLLGQSPRFTIEEKANATAMVDVQRVAGGSEIIACLKTFQGATLACSKPAPLRRDTALEDVVSQSIRSLAEQAFSPRIDLSQSEAGSLDGSNRIFRDQAL